MPNRCYGGIHANANARYGHVHKVGMLVILSGAVVGLKSLEEFPKNLLRDFTPSSFQVGEPRQAEGCIEIMRHWIKWPSQRQGIRIPFELELRHGQGVLCYRGALQLRHLARSATRREAVISRVYALTPLLAPASP